MDGGKTIYTSAFVRGLREDEARDFYRAVQDALARKRSEGQHAQEYEVAKEAGFNCQSYVALKERAGIKTKRAVAKTATVEAEAVDDGETMSLEIQDGKRTVKVSGNAKTVAAFYKNL